MGAIGSRGVLVAGLDELCSIGLRGSRGSLEEVGGSLCSRVNSPPPSGLIEICDRWGCL
jgi:hypothetical protein